MTAPNKLSGRDRARIHQLVQPMQLAASLVREIVEEVVAQELRQPRLERTVRRMIQEEIRKCHGN